MGRDAGRKHHNIISDIQPFKSPIDGTVVSSRRSLRDHEKRHDVIQVGNDRPTRTENAPMRRAGYDVKRAMETARG